MSSDNQKAVKGYKLKVLSCLIGWSVKRKVIKLKINSPNPTNKMMKRDKITKQPINKVK